MWNSSYCLFNNSTIPPSTPLPRLHTDIQLPLFHSHTLHPSSQGHVCNITNLVMSVPPPSDLPSLKPLLYSLSEWSHFYIPSLKPLSHPLTNIMFTPPPHWSHFYIRSLKPLLHPSSKPLSHPLTKAMFKFSLKPLLCDFNEFTFMLSHWNRVHIPLLKPHWHFHVPSLKALSQPLTETTFTSPTEATFMSPQWSHFHICSLKPLYVTSLKTTFHWSH